MRLAAAQLVVLGAQARDLGVNRRRHRVALAAQLVKVGLALLLPVGVLGRRHALLGLARLELALQLLLLLLEHLGHLELLLAQLLVLHGGEQLGLLLQARQLGLALGLELRLLVARQRRVGDHRLLQLGDLGGVLLAQQLHLVGRHLRLPAHFVGQLGQLLLLLLLELALEARGALGRLLLQARLLGGAVLRLVVLLPAQRLELALLLGAARLHLGAHAVDLVAPLRRRRRRVVDGGERRRKLAHVRQHADVVGPLHGVGVAHVAGVEQRRDLEHRLGQLKRQLEVRALAVPAVGAAAAQRLGEVDAVRVDLVQEREDRDAVAERVVDRVGDDDALRLVVGQLVAPPLEHLFARLLHDVGLAAARVPRLAGQNLEAQNQLPDEAEHELRVARHNLRRVNVEPRTEVGQHADRHVDVLDAVQVHRRTDAHTRRRLLERQILGQFDQQNAVEHGRDQVVNVDV